MKKHLARLLAFTAIFFTWHNAAAQKDSLLDLGRLKISKDFAQTITIRGSDLQRIPFGTISDVIAPWLQGAMNSKSNLIFVVDGNLVNDVNAWSIYDIEEITLVQNAMAQVNGAIHQQQLVLVKTKRNNTEPGIFFAASSALAKNNTNDPVYKDSETNFYHQYHVAARKNLGKISAGASVNWVRDVFPRLETPGLTTETPRQLNRFRVNGWFDVVLAEGHSISAGLNYVPQTISYEFTSALATLNTQYTRQKQTLLNPYIKFSNRIAAGLTNEISVSHLSARRPSEYRTRIEYLMPTPPNQVFTSFGEEMNKVRNLLIREQISYRKKMGNWLLEPSLNFTFRSVKQTNNLSVENYNNNVPASTSWSGYRYEVDSYILTPSVGISYRNSFHFTGGAAASLTDDIKPLGDGVFPFASVMLDLFRISNADNPRSLKIFGSFAQAPNFADMYFSQHDVSNDPAPAMGINLGPFNGMLIPSPYPEDAKRNSMQLGAVFSGAADRLQLSYHFDNRHYVDMLLYEMPTPQGSVTTVIWPDYKLSTHRLGILAQVMNKPGFRWQSGLNVATFKLKMATEQVFPQAFEVVSNNDKANWTGGFTNRLQVDQLAFGLDILYLLNEQRPVTLTTYDKVNSWRLNNVYVGYTPQIRKNYPLELYLAARNSMQSERAVFPGNDVRYFGAGLKMQL